MNKINTQALAKTTAIISAVCMLLLGILPRIGLYSGAANAMMQWHMFFTLFPLGILGGMIEAAIIGYLIGWAFGTLYNKFTK